MSGCLRRRVWAEIDLGALVRNYGRIAALVSPAKVLCVLKANAYGLGVGEYAKALSRTDCAGFGVAEPFEAMELVRCLGGAGNRVKDVQIMSAVLPDEIDEMVALGAILPVTDFDTAALISRAAAARGVVARVHFKIDSGMGRLGIPAASAMDTVRRAVALPNLDCEGIFSHCPVAYEPEDPFTHGQIARFKALLDELRGAGISFRKVHIAASDAINNFPEAARPPFTMVRTGINLHGSFDPNGRRALKVESVLSLKSRVAQVRTLPAGATIGYGRTFQVASPMRVATVSAGYADGLPLALSNRGYMLVGGARCPVVGRLSMDYTTIDVTHAPEVKPGDEVVCLGVSGGESVTPDDWAAIKGTHAYDIICSLGTRVERIARGGDSAR